MRHAGSRALNQYAVPSPLRQVVCTLAPSSAIGDCSSMGASLWFQSSQLWSCPVHLWVKSVDISVQRVN